MAIDEPRKRPNPNRKEAAAEGGGLLPDLLKRGMTLGLTGFFMTEEALRRALGETAPREMIEFVVAQSEKTRAEFLDRVSREFGKALSAMDPVEVAKRLLEGRTIEVSATIRFVEDERKKKKAESE
ncbi:MAG: hypothetical protein FJ091_06220 [Deltaproteobacteria bacterium]|nr:hypothetical protein [Deltaproteobacteria bacterium]